MQICVSVIPQKPYLENVAEKHLIQVTTTRFMDRERDHDSLTWSWSQPLPSRGGP